MADKRDWLVPMIRFRRRRWMFAALVVVGLLLLAWWYTRGSPSKGPVEETQASSRTRDPVTGARASMQVARQPPGAAADIVLPPPDAPLAETFDALAEAADAGHAPAACRLAWDLARCSQLPALASVPDALLDSAAGSARGSSDEAALVDDLVQVEGWVANGRAVCAGLSREHLHQAPRRMYQAAGLGHAPSMARFALWPPFGESLRLDDAELALAHRRHAMAFLRTAAARGEPLALWGLFVTCHDGRIPTAHGTIEVGRDPVCALATATVLRRFADPTTGAEADQVILETTSALGQQDRARASALAARYRLVFSGQPPYDFASGAFRKVLDDPCAASG